MAGVGGAYEATPLASGQPLLAHEAGDALATHLAAPGAQLGMHARAAVGAAAVLVHGHHLLGQLPVGLLPLGLRTLLPGGVARAQDAQLDAQELDGEVGLLRVDELELHVEPSFAKKAAAFLRSSAPSATAGSPCAAGAIPPAPQRCAPRPASAPRSPWPR